MLHRKKEMVMLFSAYEILQRKKKKAIDLHLILLQLS